MLDFLGDNIKLVLGILTTAIISTISTLLVKASLSLDPLLLLILCFLSWLLLAVVSTYVLYLHKKIKEKDLQIKAQESKSTKPKFKLIKGIYFDESKNPICPKCEKPMRYFEKKFNYHTEKDEFEPFFKCPEDHRYFLVNKKNEPITFEEWLK